jgi:4-amino-4-deoxy-L-arabinose transferase-like glycosyltransferase
MTLNKEFAMKTPKLWIVFLLGFIFLILGAQTLPLTDPVESNYALTAKEMAASSEWLAPRIYGKVWFDKPVLFYWFLAVAIKCFGFSELALRLFPAVFGALGITFIFWFVTKLKSIRAGTIAAIVLGTSLQYFFISKLIITDMLLFCFNAAALGFFYLGYVRSGDTKRWYLPMYLCFGLGVLTKGPVGVLLPGLVILLFLAWQKQWSELGQMKLLTGFGLFGLVALPWYLMMYVKHGNEFINTFLGVHNYLRATVSEHPKDNVWYYYPLLFLVSTLPWTGIAFGGIRDGIRKILKQHDLSLFLIIWIGVFFGFYSLMATKYPTYTFPILFPVVVLAAFYLEAGWEKNSGPSNWVLLWPLLLWQIILGAIGFRMLHSTQLVVLLSGITLSSGLTLWTLLGSKPKSRQQRHMPFYITILSYILLTTLVAPVVADYRSGKRLSQALKPYAAYQIGLYHFYSTAAVYYSGHLLIKIESTASGNQNNYRSFNWKSKYTMPTSTMKEFAAQPKKTRIIIVPFSAQREFLSETTGMPLKQIAGPKRYIIYRINAPIL